MVSDLSGLPIANASMLDELTAASEAMTMCFNMNASSVLRNFYVEDSLYPHIVEGLKARATSFGIQIKRFSIKLDITPDTLSGAFGVMIQLPNSSGRYYDPTTIASTCKTLGAPLCVGTDLLSLTLFRPPGEYGADIAFGNAQRFGVPMGFGGPHAAFLACSERFTRKLPGRIVGISKSRSGKIAYRLALQTREQHIRREKATSNICTAQALLANMNAMYAIYHGPTGLKRIAERIRTYTMMLSVILASNGFELANELDEVFDTVVVKVDCARSFLRNAELKFQLNFREYDSKSIGITLDETVTIQDLRRILLSFGIKEENTAFDSIDLLDASELRSKIPRINPSIERTSEFLQHPVFQKYHTETELLRYMRRLENKDISLVHSMIPLGSCTMKLNGTSELLSLSWPQFSSIHPFVPPQQAAGFEVLIAQLSEDLAQITGMDSASVQPNSGAQGEFAALCMIREYFRDRGEERRNICLIPVSAHGTNPASARLAGFNVVPVRCHQHTGNLDLEDLEIKIKTYAKELAVLMVTYPSTYGVFESGIRRAIDLVHENGGQVYLDGANMNAQIGICSPGELGADICHLNLHKTFCIPHGGGGPGVGPICAKNHLAPYFPGHPLAPSSFGTKAIAPVASAPWGSASLLPISWSYIRLMGSNGLTRASLISLLNANFMSKRLSKYYNILFKNENGHCGHEFIIDLRPLEAEFGIKTVDVAKRLIDYGFHSPTMSWPVVGTLMVEPTESESLEEMNRFCDALISIRQEIAMIDKENWKDNVLKMSPHSAQDVITNAWSRSYSRELAAFPLPYLKERKFWPPVTRVDDGK